MRGWWDIFAAWTILLADLVVLLVWVPVVFLPALRGVRAFRVRDIPDLWSPFGLLDRLVSDWWTPEMGRLATGAYLLMPPVYVAYAVIETGFDSLVSRLLAAQTVLSIWTAVGLIVQWRSGRPAVTNNVDRHLR